MEKTISKIKVFENKNVRTVWNEEEEDWYFSVVDVLLLLWMGTGDGQKKKDCLALPDMLRE